MRRERSKILSFSFGRCLKTVFFFSYHGSQQRSGGN
nr:MAG TPA: hypothetical protein [Caudoviricetes sp.]